MTTNAQVIIDAFRSAFDEQNNIHIQDVPEQHQKVFAVWRQHLGAVLIWNKQFTRNKDYSSAVNAVLALGKLSSVPKPTGFVSELDLNAFETMCENMWLEITAYSMVPRAESVSPEYKFTDEHGCRGIAAKILPET